jgi:PKD repeat protein
MSTFSKISSIFVIVLLLGTFWATAAAVEPLPSNRHIFINVANPDGVKYNLDGARYGGPDNTYYIKADGGGLNELHISTDPVGADRGQVTSTSTLKGTFYITNTGGRGYDNDIILLVSVVGELRDDISLHLKSSGYNWTPATPGAYTPSTPPTDYEFVNGIDLTLHKSDFIYGMHTAKPGPGGDGETPQWDLPLYYGQNVNDASTASYLMFVDLDVGNLYPLKFPGVSLVDGGAVKVEYEFTNMTTIAAFNGYGWCSAANQDQGISWTNPNSGSTASGYSVTYAGPMAEFDADAYSGESPLTVQFTDHSTNTPTSWDWDFGDGSEHGNVQNPEHTYDAAGTYAVSLTAMSASGSNTLTKTDFITVTAPAAVAPVASFTADHTAGTAPLAVQFTDTSSNVPTAWAWDFGDGAISSEQSPSHTYAAAGSYTVTMTASNAGGSSAVPATTTITVNAPVVAPVASFTTDKLSGDAPLTVQFTDTSSNVPTSWSWDFGDGSTSIEQSPAHTYTIPGTYTVSLTATNSGGSSVPATTSITVDAPVVAPVASFTADHTSGTAPLAVQFTDTSSNVPTSWSWDFGDGSTSIEQSPAHTYADAGSYTVSLTASNAGGSSAPVTTTITVNPPAPVPVASFTVNKTSGLAPLCVQFTDTSSNTPTSWDWDFGDGSAHSTEQSPVHTYNALGTYTVSLTATNAGGSSAPVTKTITVRTSVTWTVGASGCDYTQLYDALANPDLLDGDTIYVYNGTYNSGSSSPSITKSITLKGEDASLVTCSLYRGLDFTKPMVVSGIRFYSSSAQIQFKGGNSTIENCTFELLTGQMPVILFSADNVFNNNTVVSCSNIQIGFMGTPNHNTVINNVFKDSTGKGLSFEGSNSIVVNNTFENSGFVFDTICTNVTLTRNTFRDGPTIQIYDRTNFSAYLNNFINCADVTYNGAPSAKDVRFNSTEPVTYTHGGHTFTGYIGNYWGSRYSGIDANGDWIGDSPYTVRALNPVLEDSFPLLDQSQYYTGTMNAPMASFMINMTIGDVPLCVQFTDTSSNAPTSWEWDFGDSSAHNNEQNPVHTYDVAGTYTASLTTTNASGSATATRTITANSLAPVASFAANRTNGVAPLTVQFTDTSIKTPTSWSWDFGDGSTSTEQNPVHTYSDPGFYEVVLTVTNAFGSNIADREDYIVAVKPEFLPRIEWTDNFGDTYNDICYGITNTNDGGYALIGNLGIKTAQNGFEDMFLVKTDANGNQLWNKTYGGAKREYGYSVRQTADNGYILGGYSNSFGGNDAYLVKTDAAGESVWSKNYGGTKNEYAYTAIPTSDGGYAFAGYTTSYGSGVEDVYLVKTDANGNQLWYKTFGGAKKDIGYSVLQMADGGFLIGGHSQSYGIGTWDMFVVRTDASGNELWNKTYGGSGDEYGYSLIATNDGYYALVGSTTSYGSGINDVYMIKIDGSGNQIWSRTYGGTNNDYGYAVQQATDGGFAIGGYTDSYGAGGNDIYVVKTDVNGYMQWNMTSGGSGTENGYALAVGNGGYLLGGYTSTWGAGSNDWYVVKLTYYTDAPATDFRVDPAAGQAPLTVQFVDESGNVPTSWSWDFGDGSTSTEQNPAHLYANPGVYTVSLTAANPIGSNTNIKTDCVTVSPPPVITPGDLPVVLWNKTYGSSNKELCYNSLQTADKGYLMVGFGQLADGHSDILAVRTDADGRELWKNYYGGSGNEQALGAAETGDGGYLIVGYSDSFAAPGDIYAGNMFVVRTDASGTELWNKTYGGKYFEEGDVPLQTADGGFVIAGATMSYGNGSNDFWLVRMDASGNELWNKTYGGAKNDAANSLIQTSDGGYVLTGSTESFGNGDNDFYMVKTDAEGNLQWSKTFGGAKYDSCGDVQQTSDGGYILTGSTCSFGVIGFDGNGNPVQNVYLIKTDASGNAVWSKTYGGVERECGFSVRQTNDGGYIVSGRMTENTDDLSSWQEDLYLLKTDANGYELWNSTFASGDKYEEGGTIWLTNDGGYVVSGSSESYGNGSYDFYLVKLGYPAKTPVASFTASVTDGLAPLTVQFTDTSSNTPTSWEWDFGDGSAHSVEQSPVHTFNAGTYTVTLTSTNSGGSSDPVTTTITVAGTYTIELKQGWNLISLPLSNSTLTASQLADLGVRRVSSYNYATGTYTTYVVGYSAGDMPISNDYAYFVDCAADTSLVLNGNLIPQPHTLTLNQGWNAIGWGSLSSVKASDLGGQSASIQRMSRYDTSASAFTTYVVGFSGDDKNFDVRPGEGYFVYLNSATPVQISEGGNI